MRLDLEEYSCSVYDRPRRIIGRPRTLDGKVLSTMSNLFVYPTLIRYPAVIPSGQRTEALFSHVDIVPTILAAAGLPIPEDSDGVDALPLLSGEQKSVRDSLLIECIDDPQGLRLKTIVTGTRKLTWYCGHPYGELYDLENDPAERVNHWHNPEYACDKTSLLRGILEEMEPLEKRVERYAYA